VRSIVELTCVALFVGAALWFTWKRLQDARRQAEINLEQARVNLEHTRRVEAVGHDLDNLFAMIFANVSVASRDSMGELRETLDEVLRATSSARTIMIGLRRGPNWASAPLESAEGILRLLVALVGRTGASVRLECEGDLRSKGSHGAAVRLFENLLLNATREAKATGDSTVRVRLTKRAAFFTNQVLDPARLDESIYQRGVSRAGSSGMGLAIAMDAAKELGWTLRHEVVGREVTFIVEAPERFEQDDTAIWS